MPREPEVFGHPTRPRVFKRRVDDARDFLDLRPLDAGNRIEVNAKFIGMVEIVGPNRVRVELEAGQVGHPCERRRVTRHDFLRRPAGWKLQRRDFDPVGPSLRRPLLVEKFVVDAVRIPHQYVRSSSRAAQRALRNGQVYWTRSSFVYPASRKSTFRGLEIVTSRPSTTSRSRSPSAAILNPLNLKYPADHVTTIGPTVVISGELTSGEDITVQGRVNGQLMVRDAVLTIGEQARLRPTSAARACWCTVS